MNKASIRNQVCPNSFLHPTGRVYVHGRTYLRFKCSVCGKTWVFKQFTDEFYKALNMLKNGFSIRRTANYLNVSPSTIQRWKKKSTNLFNL